jgi:phage regulator Rha-like protein
MTKPDILIKNKIHTIRGVQVMLDSDLAELYGVEVKVLNQAVKRNKERFPEDFMFQLTEFELDFLRSQIVTAKTAWSKKRFLPYVFTEQGVAMLSSVLRSKKAVEANVLIMRAFVEIRRFLIKNAYVFQEFQRINQKLITHDEQLEKVFKAMDNKELPRQGIFFNCQVFDAFVFISKLIQTAQTRIVLIDNYVDENTLQLFSDKTSEVLLKIHTRHLSKKLLLAENKFNQQHGRLIINQFEDSHDRFIIIDDEVYHIGASLKDLGKRWFAFSRLGLAPEVILSRIPDEA